MKVNPFVVVLLLILTFSFHYSEMLKNITASILPDTVLKILVFPPADPTLQILATDCSSHSSHCRLPIWLLPRSSTMTISMTNNIISRSYKSGYWWALCQWTWFWLRVLQGLISFFLLLASSWRELFSFNFYGCLSH